LLELLYGSGLRVGEAIRIKIKDVDLINRIAFVRNGKGGKDRMVRLSEMFVNDFNIYYQYVNNFENNYLFESQQRIGMHISIRTAQKILEYGLKKANITKKAHLHTLRTSFATHLIQNNVDVSYVQKLLGHSRLETTQRYIRLDDSDLQLIKSPLD